MIVNNISLLTQLTEYAKGLVNDPAKSVANVIAPVVRVPTISGFYKAFDDKEAFQVYNTKRTPGGPARRITLSATDATYSCTSKALELLIADEVATKSINGGAELPFYKNMVASLLSCTWLAHEKEVFDFISTNVSSTATKVWSNSTASVLTDILGQSDTISNDTGQPANVVVFGNSAWTTFSTHPIIQGFFPGAPIITPEAVQNVLRGYGIEKVAIAHFGYDTKLGQTKSGTAVLGNTVYIAQANQAASQFDNSAIKQFFYNENLGNVTSYREESLRSDVLAVDWANDIKLANSYGIKRLTIT